MSDPATSSKDNDVSLEQLASEAADHPTDVHLQQRAGWSLYLADRLNEASTLLREASSRTPDDSEISYLLALTLSRQGQQGQAAEQYEITLENLEGIEDKGRREMLRRIVKRQLHRIHEGSLYLEGPA